jgi:hypothetical protein
MRRWRAAGLVDEILTRAHRDETPSCSAKSLRGKFFLAVGIFTLTKRNPVGVFIVSALSTKIKFLVRFDRGHA